MLHIDAVNNNYLPGPLFLIGMARRYLRMAMCLMRNAQVYLPGDLRRKDSDSKQRADYYMKMWPSLRDKWKKIVQDFYEIKLSL